MHRVLRDTKAVVANWSLTLKSSRWWVVFELVTADFWAGCPYLASS